MKSGPLIIQSIGASDSLPHVFGPRESKFGTKMCIYCGVTMRLNLRNKACKKRVK